MKKFIYYLYLCCELVLVMVFAASVWLGRVYTNNAEQESLGCYAIILMVPTIVVANVLFAYLVHFAKKYRRDKEVYQTIKEKRNTLMLATSLGWGLLIIFFVLLGLASLIASIM